VWDTLAIRLELFLQPPVSLSGDDGLKARNAQRYVRNAGQCREKPSVRLRRGLNLSLVDEVSALVLSFMSAIRTFKLRTALGKIWLFGQKEV
jgi:hypothetical protein